MSSRLEDLAPEVQPKARELLDALLDHGIRYKLLETLRTLPVQQAYFAQHRLPFDEVNRLRMLAGLWVLTAEENNYIITNCDGIRYPSAHQSGRALDIVPLTAEGQPTWDTWKYPEGFHAIGAVSKSLGFTWGGDWPPLDPRTGLGWDACHHEWRTT